MATEQDLNASIPAEDKIVLDAPQGVLLKSLKMRVCVEPEAGAITIYGYMADKTIQPFAVAGGVKVVELPFVLPPSGSSGLSQRPPTRSSPGAKISDSADARPYDH